MVPDNRETGALRYPWWLWTFALLGMWVAGVMFGWVIFA